MLVNGFEPTKIKNDEIIYQDQVMFLLLDQNFLEWEV